MAKKQTIASEIGSALGAVAARAEQLIASNPTKNTTKPAAAKRTLAAKHSATTAPKKAAANAKTTAAPEIVITQEAIAEQAYLYWEARGYQGGDSVSDWTRAEEELKQRTLAAAL
jgi:hypothetical protein